jgi:AraC-like DNA-binding protein
MRLTSAEKKIIEDLHNDLTYNFLEKLTINERCEIYNISETKLTKGFKALYGTTIYRYHLGKCMEFAHEKFLEGSTVNELTILLNYSTISSFTRAFKKIYPDPPRVYRYDF